MSTSCRGRAYERLQAEHDDLTTRGRIEIAQAIETRPRARRPLRERRLPRGQGRAGPDGGPHPPARRHPEERRDRRRGRPTGVVGPGSVVTIVYDGDDDDDAERYLIGPIEERHDELDVISPGSPLGAALIGHRAGDVGRVRGADGHAAGPDRRRRGRLRPTERRGRRAGPVGPPLPPGREVELPGRGTTFVRELAGPPGAPVVVLLHGWTVDGRPQLVPARTRRSAERFRVLALDHRGHGRGIRSRRAVPARGLRRRRRRPGRRARHRPRRRWSATRWADRSPSSLWRRHRDRVDGPGAVRHGAQLHVGGVPEERLWFVVAGRPGRGLAARRRRRPGAGCPTSSSPAAAASTSRGPTTRSAARLDARCSRPAASSAGSRRCRGIGRSTCPTAVDRHHARPRRAAAPPAAPGRVDPGATAFPSTATTTPASTAADEFVPTLVAACDVGGRGAVAGRRRRDGRRASASVAAGSRPVAAVRRAGARRRGRAVPDREQRVHERSGRRRIDDRRVTVEQPDGRAAARRSRRDDGAPCGPGCDRGAGSAGRTRSPGRRAGTPSRARREPSGRRRRRRRSPTVSRRWYGLPSPRRRQRNACPRRAQRRAGRGRIGVEREEAGRAGPAARCGAARPRGRGRAATRWSSVSGVIARDVCPSRARSEVVAAASRGSGGGGRRPARWPRRRPDDAVAVAPPGRAGQALDRSRDADGGDDVRRRVADRRAAPTPPRPPAPPRSRPTSAADSPPNRRPRRAVGRWGGAARPTGPGRPSPGRGAGPRRPARSSAARAATPATPRTPAGRPSRTNSCTLSPVVVAQPLEHRPRRLPPGEALAPPPARGRPAAGPSANRPSASRRTRPWASSATARRWAVARGSPVGRHQLGQRRRRRAPGRRARRRPCPARPRRLRWVPQSKI